MKELKKILLMEIPAAVRDALTEQYVDQGILLVHRPQVEDIFDLVVTMQDGQEKACETFPGCPVLALSLDGCLRLGAILRRIAHMLQDPALYLSDVPMGEYVFRPQEKQWVNVQGKSISLTDREVDILAFLVRHHDHVVSRDDMLKYVWQYQEGVDTHTLETHIYRLRQKMGLSAESNSGILVTEAGGYRLCLNKDEGE